MENQKSPNMLRKITSNWGLLLLLTVAALLITGIFTFSEPQEEIQDSIPAECYVVDRYTTRGLRIAKGITTRKYYFTLILVTESSYDYGTIEVSKRTYDFFMQPDANLPCTITYDNDQVSSIEVHDDRIDQITATEDHTRTILIAAASVTIIAVLAVLFKRRQP